MDSQLRMPHTPKKPTTCTQNLYSHCSWLHWSIVHCSAAACHNASQAGTLTANDIPPALAHHARWRGCWPKPRQRGQRISSAGGNPRPPARPCASTAPPQPQPDPCSSRAQRTQQGLPAACRRILRSLELWEAHEPCYLPASCSQVKNPSAAGPRQPLRQRALPMHICLSGPSLSCPLSGCCSASHRQPQPPPWRRSGRHQSPCEQRQGGDGSHKLTQGHTCQGPDHTWSHNWDHPRLARAVLRCCSRAVVSRAGSDAVHSTCRRGGLPAAAGAAGSPCLQLHTWALPAAMPAWHTCTESATLTAQADPAAGTQHRPHTQLVHHRSQQPQPLAPTVTCPSCQRPRPPAAPSTP